MNITAMLADLRLQRDLLTAAILSLERYTIGRRKPGRPPAWQRMTVDAHKRGKGK